MIVNPSACKNFVKTVGRSDSFDAHPLPLESRPTAARRPKCNLGGAAHDETRRLLKRAAKNAVDQVWASQLA